jgi:ribosomal-protein-alanine N-acetyltransferase
MSEKNQQLRLEGEKIFLRYIQKQDAAEFIRLNLASREFHRGLVTPPLDEDSYDKYFVRNASEADERFFICLQENGKIAGSINLSQIFYGNFCNAYLGYFVGAEYAGRGLTTEAIRLILDYAFGKLKLHRAEANVQPKNLASIAVLRKNGFTKEGFSRRYLKIDKKWRDHERWAIIAEDWKTTDKNNGK